MLITLDACLATNWAAFGAELLVRPHALEETAHDTNIRQYQPCYPHRGAKRRES